MDTVDSSLFRESLDLLEMEACNGMLGASIDMLPKVKITEEYNCDVVTSPCSIRPGFLGRGKGAELAIVGLLEHVPWVFHESYICKQFAENLFHYPLLKIDLGV